MISFYSSDREIKRGTNFSNRGEIFPWILASIVFSLPLETLLPHYFNTRSHVYYLSIIALLFSLLHINQLILNFNRSKGLLLIILSFSWTILVYYLNPSSYDNGEIVLIVQLILFCLMLLFVADKQIWRTRLIWMYWLGWVILCVLSIQFYLAGNVYIYSYRELDIERVIGVLGFSAAQYGSQLAAGFMVAFILFLRQEKSFKKVLLFGSVMLGAVATLLTASRTSVISLLLAIGMYFIVEVGRQRNKFIRENVATIFALLLSLFVIFTQTKLGSSLMDPFVIRLNQTIQTGDTTGRTELAFAAWELTKENPIFGIGKGNAGFAMSRYSPSHPLGVDVHNFYLKMLVEGGGVGLFLFAVGLYLVVRQGWRWYQFSGESIYFYPLLVLLIIAIGGRPFHYKILWFFLACNTLTPYIDMSKSSAPSPKQG